ncbi:MAG: YkvA family protein [Chloroflexota bacterium]
MSETRPSGAMGIAGGPLGLWLNARLAWRLFRDERVPVLSKLIVPAAALYLVWPLDLMVDFLPVVGQVDDATLIILATLLFIRSAPARVVAEHRARLQGRPARAERGDTIEGTYRVVDDEEKR